jgi:Isocitrate lyase family
MYTHTIYTIITAAVLHKHKQAGMTKAQMASFNDDLGALGFVFQFITLAGFHADGLITARLSRVSATVYCMNLLDCTETVPSSLCSYYYAVHSGAEAVGVTHGSFWRAKLLFVHSTATLHTSVSLTD